ncbi:hypothetical protein HELRODRAFT_171375 [Helobdella robusta]|uniref:Uncharacterized protein n=1 Tax=Helobdella robusta TaxID=6412 RepID=T1F472_HELRO|nr:hypothetical protein HELRODRAFT_171375 [Helobdella robusta]ESO05713.1 hypothetical protein HELRODRAFT_171375 [Helobdella robusta]
MFVNNIFLCCWCFAVRENSSDVGSGKQSLVDDSIAVTRDRLIDIILKDIKRREINQATFSTCLLSTGSTEKEKKNIDVDAQSFQGNTALHIATASKNLKIIALLVAAGSDCNIKNSDVKHDSSDYKSSDDSESCSEWINADVDLSSVMYRKCRLNETDSSSEDENDTNKGMTARDYSFGDEKILMLLDGKTYDEVVKERVADVQTGTALDSHQKLLLSINFDSGLGSLS